MDQRDKGERRGLRGQDHRGERPAAAKRYDRGERPAAAKRYDHGERPAAAKRYDHGERPAPAKRYDRGERPAAAKRYDHGERPAAAKRYDHGEKPAAMDAARDVALRALRAVARENAYAAQALDRELSAAHLSEEDRRFAASLFYFTLENRLHIEHCLAARLQTRPAPEVMDILCLAAAQILYMDRVPDHAAVDEAVKQARRARFEGMTPLVNAVLRGLIRDRDANLPALPDRGAEPGKYISERYSVALPLAERLVCVYGAEEAEQIAAWSPNRRCDTIRANALRMTDAQFEAWLDANAFSWSKGVVPGAYRVANAGRLASHAGYREGTFSIQGESSMLAARALCVRPGMQVLDACAAPGGKACLLAETMRGAGRVFAWDLHEHRVDLIRAAVRRLGLENVRPQVRDATKRMESMEGMLDAVLVDAPCSGLGVMSDKPDIKYRLTMDTVQALLPIQRDILNACASCVRAGGLLVYSTCTILPEENEAQVRAFLAAHPEFEPDADDRWLPEALRGRLREGMIQILPSRDGLDGFFIARMRRKADCYAG